MLGRFVEKKIDDEGMDAVFSNVAPVLRTYPYVVANFEGVVPEIHIPTKKMEFRFSFRAKFAETLASFGITHVGLANNHAFDFGVEGYEHSKEVVRGAGLVTMGHPRQITMDDVALIHYGTYVKRTIALIPIHATESVDMAQVESVLTDAAEVSDMQIVYIHWGTEYVRDATPDQRTLAHSLIDHGADAIVGHHPHVTETIELYNGAPIFYSLGNFVFDQYWNDDVQTGLAVALSITRKGMTYTLYPTRSEKSTPRFLTGAERTAVLVDIASHSDENLRVDITQGVLTVKGTPLASER
jgi:poly-gamma-glutamate synthesis protein (capsule biosynthesis protein)